MSVDAPVPLLRVRDLETHLMLRRGVVRAVDGVSFEIDTGEALGLIGESGSGKSMTGLSLLSLLPQPAGRIVGGSIELAGRELVGLDEETFASEIRGREIAMISQDPMTSLNPVFTIGGQISAPIRRHGYDRAENTTAHDLAVAELERVRVPSAAARSHDYPHQFSGGMRQRVVAAMALGCRPRLLIADEPTSALDVTIQVQFMRLIEELQAETGVGLLFITHDLGVAASLCQKIAVMYAGRIVEIAKAADLYDEPLHPYTQGLLRSVPRLGSRAPDNLSVRAPDKLSVRAPDKLSVRAPDNLDVRAAGAADPQNSSTLKRERLYSIPGTPPDPLHRPSGCAFAPRCAYAEARCHSAAPVLRESGDRRVACWLHDDQ